MEKDVGKHEKNVASVETKFVAHTNSEGGPIEVADLLSAHKARAAGLYLSDAISASKPFAMLKDELLGELGTTCQSSHKCVVTLGAQPTFDFVSRLGFSFTFDGSSATPTVIAMEESFPVTM